MEGSPGRECRRWHVIMTKPGDEARVSDQLTQRLGMETYAPVIEVQVRRNRRLVAALRPLFPGYLFARLDLPREWRVVSYTRGVIRILGGWREPVSLGDEVIESVRSRERSPDRVIEYFNFKPRERLVIRSGCLKDLDAIFDRYVGDSGRVRVLLSLIGYQATAELDASLLEKA